MSTKREAVQRRAVHAARTVALWRSPHLLDPSGREAGFGSYSTDAARAAVRAAPALLRAEGVYVRCGLRSGSRRFHWGSGVVQHAVCVLQPM